MRSILLSIIVAVAFATPVFSQQQQLPYGSRVGMNVTVVRSGGIGSEMAYAEIAHTRKNAREFCRKYLSDNSPKCVRKNLDIGTKDKITANCANGIFYDAFGTRFQFRGLNFGRSDHLETEYIIFDYIENAPLCSASACGYEERLIAFSFLCPNRVLESQARRKAIAILIGDPYGKTEKEVNEKIVKATFFINGSSYCGKRVPSWVFLISVPESANQSKFEGPLVIDARSGAMLCAGLPFLD